MNILLNSKEYELPDAGTIRTLITQLNLTQQRVAVEVNTELIIKNQWESFTLKENDRVEVVTFVGGG
jgi:thiamine biosynthesis protein ThiS